MSKNILFRWFKLGAIPQPIWEKMKEETILEYDEGCRASTTYHKFRAKGRYFSNKSEVFFGFLILTKKRFLGYAFKKRIINVDSSFQNFDIRLEKENCILFHFEAEKIIPNSSGTIEIRYHTAKARQFVELFQTEFLAK